MDYVEHIPEPQIVKVNYKCQEGEQHHDHRKENCSDIKQKTRKQNPKYKVIRASMNKRKRRRGDLDNNIFKEQYRVKTLWHRCSILSVAAVNMMILTLCLSLKNDAAQPQIQHRS